MSERDPFYAEPVARKIIDEYGGDLGEVFLACYYMSTKGMEVYDASPKEIADAIFDEISKNYGSDAVEKYKSFVLSNVGNKDLLVLCDKYSYKWDLIFKLYTEIRKKIRTKEEVEIDKELEREQQQRKQKIEKEKEIERAKIERQKRNVKNQITEKKKKLIALFIAALIFIAVIVLEVVNQNTLWLYTGLILLIIIYFAVKTFFDIKSLKREEINMCENNDTKKETSKNELKNESKFYSDCVISFHNLANKIGYHKKGVIFIPELIPLGEKTVLAFLQDPFFSSEFGDNPTQYYYLINSLSFMTGVAYAAKWHEDFDGLKNGFVDTIIKEGPPDYATPIIEKDIGIPTEKINDFYGLIFDEWINLHEPYWKLEDPRQYTFKAMIASYQLGVSMTLEKLGY